MDFNKIKAMGLEYAEKGKNAAMDLAEKGKTQALLVNEQGKLLMLCWLVAIVTAVSGIKYLWDNRSFINTAK